MDISVYALSKLFCSSSRFGAEDEDLEINYSYIHTSEINFKDPPWVYINGGPDKEENMIANQLRGESLLKKIDDAVNGKKI